jgi:hypothetical protein
MDWHDYDEEDDLEAQVDVKMPDGKMRYLGPDDISFV